MTVNALWEAWTEVLKQQTIVRSFERTGLSLPIDASQDSIKMSFQGQDPGVPPGLVYENPI